MKPFFDLVSEIDALVQKAPAVENIKEFSRILSDNAGLHAYAFKQLLRADWIEPLRSRGYFNVDVDDKGEGGTGTGGADWPQSQYLKRMSAVPDRDVQLQVLNIMLDVSATKNRLIHTDFAEAALALPVDLAAKWAMREVEWLKHGYVIHGFLETNLGKLISKLAKEREAQVAVKLAAELLSISPDPEEAAKRAIKDEMERIVRGSLVPVTRCDRFNYEQVLTKHIPDLAVSEPFGTLDLLCALLEKAILCSQREGEARKPHDPTFIWRPAIEENDQNKDYKIDCPLITAIRDTAESICERQPERTAEVVLTIEKYEWNVFRRIGMHILRAVKDAPVEMIEQRLANRDLLLDPHCHHEYYHLLKDKFRFLSAARQQEVLGLINQGEDLAARDDLPPERRVQRKEQWQHRILSAIKDDLPAGAKAQYQKLDAKLGKSVMPPDFNAYSSGGIWQGPQSPRKIDDLALMTNDELIAFLKDWQPSGEWMSPTPYGLGAVLGELVQKQPDRFLTDRVKFMDEGLSPTYIRNIISGFCRVLEGGGKVSFEPVYELCGWVLRQDKDMSGRVWPDDFKDGIDVDMRWRFAHVEALRFIDKSLSDEAGMPFSFRKQVWDLLRPLTDDPDPTVEEEKDRINDSNDPLSLSINTMRGKALHAAMKYAMWVYRNIKDEIKTRENRTPNFTDMEEVREVMTDHLNLAVDQTQTSRAVYGQWIAQFIHLGPEWVKDNMALLFPREPKRKPLRDAVWNTYLIYGGQLRRNVVGFLRDIYREEIKALEGAQIGEKSRESPSERLAEHAVIIYLWEEHNLDGDTLINLFLSVAPPHLITHVMDFIGRDVFRSKEVDPGIIGRMQALWDWRVKRGCGYEKMNKDELAAFGWWFASEKFEPDWALRNLAETLKMTPINASNLQAVEYLSDLYSSYPAEVMRCLQLFVHVNSDPWFFVSSRKQKGVWTILDQGMVAEDAAIRDKAEEIVHLLGSKGHLEYRELLRKRTATGNPVEESRVVEGA